MEESANIQDNFKVSGFELSYEFYKDYFDGIISFEKEDRETPSKGAKNKGQ